ncbi:hypothetical protein O6467_25325, partial [Salmonella enterica subsp. enterica]
VFGVAGVCGKGQQQQGGEDEAVKGSGHSLGPCSNKCGSWLACDGGGSAARNSDWTAAFASKPAPTGDLRGAENVGTTTNQMWELA